MAPDPFEPLTGIGLDHDEQTSARQTFGTELFVQFICCRSRRERGDVDTLSRRIKKCNHVE
jgi:hypothetical protein